MIIRLSTAFLLLLNLQTLFGQKSEKAKPLLMFDQLMSDTLRISKPVDSLAVIPKQKFPLQIGYTVPAHWYISDSIATTNKKDDTRIYRVVIKTDAPCQLIFYFNDFHPGQESRLFAFSKNPLRSQCLFDGLASHKSSAYAITSDCISNETVLQFETVDSDFSLSLSEIGIIENSEVRTGFGSSGSCEVNTNCSEGDAWKLIKQGIARVLVKKGSSLFYCTGTLINNTLQDYTPYFLTANHCGDGASTADYNQWIFDFSYEGTQCEDPLSEPSKNTLVGATLMANGATYTGSDFKLLKLNQSVPASFDPFFNGWSADAGISVKGACIHHPQGDIKKISTYTQSSIPVNYNEITENENGNFWLVHWSETQNGFGVTEGGSSGSPLFNDAGLVIGSLTGGTSDCSATGEPDFFGRFNKSWESNGTLASSQLKPWLDPLLSGTSQLGGLGLLDDMISATFSADYNEINLNQSVSFANTSFGRITSFSWYFEGGKPETSNDLNPEPIEYPYLGTFDVQLIVANELYADTLLLKDYIEVLPHLYPNPNTGIFSLHFGTEQLEDAQIQLIDNAGREICLVTEQNGNIVNITTSHLIPGVYYLVIQSLTLNKRLKVILIP